MKIQIIAEKTAYSKREQKQKQFFSMFYCAYL